MLAQPLDERRPARDGAEHGLGARLVARRRTSSAPIAYAASKGAIRAMTLAAAARYARDRIRFNLIAPGLIDTPMAARAVGDPAIRAYLATKQPMAGGPGTAEDCAEAALYLCEPASRFVTGVVLNVDGGWCVSEGQIPRRRDRIPSDDRHDRRRPRADRPTTSLTPVPPRPSARRSTRSRRRSSPAIRAGGRAVRRDDPGGPAGPRLRHGPLADGRRGDVPALRLVPGLPPDRRAVDDLSQPGRRGQRPAAGDVPGERPGLRPGPLAELRDVARTTASWPSPPAAATP